MPIHHAIWRVGEQPAPLVSILLASEQQLGDMTHAHHRRGGCFLYTRELLAIFVLRHRSSEKQSLVNCSFQPRAVM